jgi:hypothetical protein
MVHGSLEEREMDCDSTHFLTIPSLLDDLLMVVHVTFDCRRRITIPDVECVLHVMNGSPLGSSRHDPHVMISQKEKTILRHKKRLFKIQIHLLLWPLQNLQRGEVVKIEQSVKASGNLHRS